MLLTMNSTLRSLPLPPPCTPPPPPSEASEVGAECRTLKWKPSGCLSHPSSTSPIHTTSLAWVAFLGGELVRLAPVSASAHTPPHPPHPPKQSPGVPGDLPSAWTSHGSPTTSLLHPTNHFFLVICMATLLHLAAQGSFLASLPQLTLVSWATLDSPATPPHT